MIWLITANTSSCRIFNYDTKSPKLTLIKELNHFQSKLKSFDLASDGPGHYHTTGGARGSFSAHENPRDVEIENFAREIAKTLDEGRTTNQYKKIILIALPHMIGLIHQHLNKHTKEMISENIHKDYHDLNANQILTAIHK